MTATPSIDQPHMEEVPALILNIWNAVEQIKEEKKSMETNPVMNKIVIRPNPFETSITLELGLAQNEHVIVRMTDSKGTIKRLFGWHLISGTNVTSISGLSSLEPGDYQIEVLSHIGVNLFSQSLTKA